MFFQLLSTHQLLLNEFTKYFLLGPLEKKDLETLDFDLNLEKDLDFRVFSN